MPWQMLAVARMLVTSVLHPLLLKHVSDLPSKTWRQFYVYFLCALYSVAFAISTKHTGLSLSMLGIGALGLANSLAIYCNFRAVNISLSKSAALSPLATIIAVVLGYTFLNEWQYLNMRLIVGVLLCLSAVALFMFYRRQSATANLTSARNRRFIAWVAGYSFIWGAVAFFMRSFAMQNVSLAEFSLGWYGGSWLGSSILLLTIGRSERPVVLAGNIIGPVLALALVIWLSFQLSYSALSLAPLTVVEPLFLVGETFIPVLIGLWWFKEIKQFSTKEIFAVLMALAGGILIIFGF